MIARSPPVSMPITQDTSPQLKTRYSHANQATSWHGNHSATSRSDKSNYCRRDDNLSCGYLYTSNHNKLDTSRSIKTTNSELSNNSTPLWTNTTTTTTTTTATTTTTTTTTATTTTTTTNNNNTNMGELLSIDTNVHTNNLPIQTISSPYSAEVVQQAEESHSYPVSDCNRTDRLNISHHLHHSLSDSVIIPMGVHQYSNEPFHTVSQSSEMAMCRVEETAGKSLSFSLNNQNYGNMCRKWPSTELYHDSDDDFNSSVNRDHSGEDVTMNNDGQVIDNDDDSNVVVVDMNSNSSIQLAAGMLPVDNDIDFLKNCFPNILADQVVTVYNDCECNIETAVGRLLQLPTSPLPRLTDFAEVWQENEEARKLFQEESSGQTVDDSKGIVLTEDIQTTCTDEEVARALQDQLDKALLEEKSSGLETSKSLLSQNEPSSINDAGDEGLILRLSPSLASKLQDMFGSIKGYLIADGEL